MKGKVQWKCIEIALQTYVSYHIAAPEFTTQKEKEGQKLLATACLDPYNAWKADERHTRHLSVKPLNVPRLCLI
jgi:hypothetical protein